MSIDYLAAACSAAVTAGLAALGPSVMRRLPEPRGDPLTEPHAEAPAQELLDTPPADPEPLGTPAESCAPPQRIAYHELAGTRGLAQRLGVGGAVVGGVVGARLGLVPVVGAWICLAAVGVVLGYIDARTHLLPTRVIAPSYLVLVAALTLAAVLDGSTQPLLRAGLGWVVMGGFYFVLWVVHPTGLGYGDVRLAGLLGLGLGYLGWAELLTGMYAGFLLGAVGGLVLTVAKLVDRKRYPFGPFMLLGALVGLQWGPALGHRYTVW